MKNIRLPIYLSTPSLDAIIGADYLLGYTKIGLDALSFDHREIRKLRRRKSNKNMNSLVALFRQVGCQHNLEEHAMTAIVREDELGAALEDLGLESLPRSDTNVPTLDISTVYSLHGLYRVCAGKLVLKGAHRWWLVRLYSYCMFESAANNIKELATYFYLEPRETDGDIFRRILLCRGTPEEAIWNTRLSQMKQKDLKQLMNNAGFMAVLTRLTNILALWTPLELGSH
jgi:hypothetical protein